MKQKPNCTVCEDEGTISKTEWTGTDDSYEVKVKCVCNEDSNENS